MSLIGTGEIKERHGITRTQVFRLLAAGDWPKPHTSLDAGQKLWQERQVTAAVDRLFKRGRLAQRNGTVVLVPTRFLATKKGAGAS